jgi:hypothetical protein
MENKNLKKIINKKKQNITNFSLNLVGLPSVFIHFWSFFL